MGICASANYNLILQYGIELTYPEPVAYMAGINGIAQQLTGVIVIEIGQTIISQFSVDKYEAITGGLYANIFNCGLLFVAVIIQFFVRNEQRRQNINGTLVQCCQNLARIRSKLNHKISL